MPSGARCSPQKGHVFSPVENWLEEWPYDAFWRLFLRVNGGEQSVVQVCCIFGVLPSALYSERFPRNWGAKQWGYSGSALGLSAVRLELFKFYKVVFLFKDATKIVGELPIFGQGMTVLKLLTHLFKMCFWGSEEYYQRISVVFYYFFFLWTKTGWKNSVVQTKTRNISFMIVVSPLFLFLCLVSGLSVAVWAPQKRSGFLVL